MSTRHSILGGRGREKGGSWAVARWHGGAVLTTGSRGDVGSPRTKPRREAHHRIARDVRRRMCRHAGCHRPSQKGRGGAPEVEAARERHGPGDQWRGGDLERMRTHDVYIALAGPRPSSNHNVGLLQAAPSQEA